LSFPSVLHYIRGSCVEILDAFVGRTVHGGGTHVDRHGRYVGVDRYAV